MVREVLWNRNNDSQSDDDQNYLAGSGKGHYIHQIIGGNELPA